MILIHELKNKVSNLITLHYFYIMQSLMVGIIQSFFKIEIQEDKINIIFFICLIGLILSAYFCQILITKSMYLKKASYILPFGYLTIISSFFVDIVLFSEEFDNLSILGMLLASSGLLAQLFISE